VKINLYYIQNSARSAQYTHSICVIKSTQ
jgi:hypothetical protein